MVRARNRLVFDSQEAGLLGCMVVVSLRIYHTSKQPPYCLRYCFCFIAQNGVHGCGFASSILFLPRPDKLQGWNLEMRYCRASAVLGDAPAGHRAVKKCDKNSRLVFYLCTIFCRQPSFFAVDNGTGPDTDPDDIGRIPSDCRP